MTGGFGHTPGDTAEAEGEIARGIEKNQRDSGAMLSSVWMMMVDGAIKIALLLVVIVAFFWLVDRFVM